MTGYSRNLGDFEIWQCQRILRNVNFESRSQM